MKLPRLASLPAYGTGTVAFRGYNHSNAVGEGEFYDMENLCSDGYPALTPRAPRGIALDGIDSRYTNIVAKDEKIVLREGKTLYEMRKGASGRYAKHAQLCTLPLAADIDRTLINLGSRLVIFPDKMWCNLVQGEFEPFPMARDTIDQLFDGWMSLGYSQEAQRTWDIINIGAEIRFSGKDMQPVVVHVTHKGKYKPEIAITEYTLSFSMDILTDDLVDKVDTVEYRDHQNGSLEEAQSPIYSWFLLDDTLLSDCEFADSKPELAQYFHVGDVVKITGFTVNPQYDGFYKILAVDDVSLRLQGAAFGNGQEDAHITISRVVPDMDFVIEHGNRLWGCSSADNTLYASALGDPFNWYRYDHSSDGSWYGEVGSGGRFTGAVSYGGHPIFFKEEAIYKIFGETATQFGYVISAVQGIEKGSEHSAVVANETLYYKCRNGVVAYNGGVPVVLSEPFGNVAYHNVVAGSAGNKCYLSMQDEAGGWHLFVYDARRGLWYREDGAHIKDFAYLDGELLFLHPEAGTVYRVSGDDEGPVRWWAETGDLNAGLAEHTRLVRLDLNAELAADSTMAVSIQTRRGGRWEPIRAVRPRDKRLIRFPILPRRGDYIRLRIEGRGPCRVFSMVRYTAPGGET